MRFDWTVSIGNILSAAAFALAAVYAWKDMSWRIKNLETWRTEHMVDSDARDLLIQDMTKILEHVRWQTSTMLGKHKHPPFPE